ncbi:hypothetical protein T11_12484 [Trichinella zimbabwensis]|uniref:Uncharacterized protein n=1 Tax=Trichinella zimbabwensis TaxID=268475 RepID=A0A0V1H2M4_9BILA|nr:hypothetical protein T11_12484 [Trichinella zimbabwensis]
MVRILNLATHVDRHARHTVSADVLAKGTTSGQRVKRSIIVSRYENQRDVGSGPSMSRWTWSKRLSGTVKTSSRVFVC